MCHCDFIMNGVCVCIYMYVCVCQLCIDSYVCFSTILMSIFAAMTFAMVLGLFILQAQMSMNSREVMYNYICIFHIAY